MRDSVDSDFIYSIPALPTTNGRIISPVEVYNYNIPVFNDKSDADNLSKFEVENVSQNSQDRQTLIKNLTNCFKQLTPVLIRSDSPASLKEPVYHLLFSSIFFFYREVVGFNFNRINQDYNNFLHNFSQLIMDWYYLYKIYFNNNGKSQPEIMMAIKNIIMLFQIFQVNVTNRARLLSIRSKTSLFIIEARHNDNMSSLLGSVKTPDIIDKIIEHMDYKSMLESCCVPDTFRWINCDEILHYIMQSSFIPNETFSLNVRDPNSNCICSILDKVCTHQAPNTTKSIGNFSLSYIPTYVLLEFGYNCLEDLFTRKYLMYLNKLQFDHEFLPIDMNINYNHISIPPITKESIMYFAYSLNDPTRSFRQHPVNSLFFNHLMALKSNVDTSKITPPTQEEIIKYRNSLPTLEINALSIDSSYEVAQTWTKFAVQLAYISMDVYSILVASSYLIHNYMFVARDYVNGILEIEKIIQFQYNCLLSLPPSITANYAMRRLVQSQIIRDKSILMQFRKFKLTATQSIFYPGQLMSIKISMLYNLIF